MQDEAQKYLKDVVETGRATLRVVSIYAEKVFNWCKNFGNHAN